MFFVKLRYLTQESSRASSLRLLPVCLDRLRHLLLAASGTCGQVCASWRKSSIASPHKIQNRVCVNFDRPSSFGSGGAGRYKVVAGAETWSVDP